MAGCAPGDPGPLSGVLAAVLHVPKTNSVTTLLRTGISSPSVLPSPACWRSGRGRGKTHTLHWVQSNVYLYVGTDYGPPGQPSAVLFSPRHEAGERQQHQSPQVTGERGRERPPCTLLNTQNLRPPGGASDDGVRDALLQGGGRLWCLGVALRVSWASLSYPITPTLESLAPPFRSLPLSLSLGLSLSLRCHHRASSTSTTPSCEVSVSGFACYSPYHALTAARCHHLNHGPSPGPRRLLSVSPHFLPVQRWTTGSTPARSRRKTTVRTPSFFVGRAGWLAARERLSAGSCVHPPLTSQLHRSLCFLRG